MSQEPQPISALLPKKKPGRPPSEAARQAILATAYRILMQEGLGRLTVERVALEAGVGKPTIYRSWTNAQELAMAAFMSQPEPQAGDEAAPSQKAGHSPKAARGQKGEPSQKGERSPDAPQSGEVKNAVVKSSVAPVARAASDSAPARLALKAHLQSVMQAFATNRGRQITLTMASADPQSELAKAFRSQIILKGREVGRGLLQAAVVSGEICLASNTEAVLDMIYGPLFFRLLVGHLALEDQFSDQLVDAIFDGIGVPASPLGGVG